MAGLEEHIGARIKAHRELLGLDVETLAKRSGLPLLRLEAYEAGLRRVIPDDLFRLCKALEASPASFLTGIPDPKRDPGDSEETEAHLAGRI